MSDNKIRRFPITGAQRWRNRLGQRAIPCIVSDRWLQLSEESKFFSDIQTPPGHYFELDVMTAGDYEKPRKLCRLVISKEAVLSALNKVADQ